MCPFIGNSSVNIDRESLAKNGYEVNERNTEAKLLQLSTNQCDKTVQTVSAFMSVQPSRPTVIGLLVVKFRISPGVLIDSDVLIDTLTYITFCM